MTINHEFWKLAATGLVDGGEGTKSLLSLLKEIPDNDKRRALVNAGAIDGCFVWEVYKNQAFGYVISKQTVLLCWDALTDLFYSPEVKTDPPKPTGATVSGSALVANDPGVGYTVYVYAWDYVRFAEVGTLLENSTPGTGVYVLVTHGDGESRSLPTSFLQIP